ncbi:PolC-type DNA polymerase III [Mesomycoplasma hyorhinis]|uniref:PolC-type DNA polymerase III n=2 Tax=Mesomycoplasma hyorhinis TaxID=2100 RepID=UPI001C03C46A|nr:PolC-type DNA polymerase III [Mesomycoplasma hyorhinis]
MNDNQSFISFCKNINYVIPSYLLETQASLEEIITKDSKKYILKIKSLNMFKFQDFINFQQKIQQSFFQKFNYKILFEYEQQYCEKEEFLKYINFIYLTLYKKEDFFNQFRLQNKAREFWFYFMDEEIAKDLEAKKDKILSLLKRFGLSFIDINFVVDYENIKKQALAFQEFLTNQKEENLKQAQKEAQQQVKPLKTFSRTKFSKSKKYVPLKLKEVRTANEQFIAIQGQIYKLEDKVTKNKNVLRMINISDYEEAIIINHFCNPENFLDLKIGDFIHVYGEITKDFYTRDIIVKSDKIEKIDNFFPIRVDEANTKRVELFARTKMSTMDGVTNAQDYVKIAKLLGHSAIGISDLESVQAFPDFYFACKNAKIKAIYGSTFSTTHSKIFKVLNLRQNQDLEHARYVVFDLETTGLSPKFNELIEFGAVVWQNGQILEKHEFLIKPKEKITSYISDLTGITNQMIENEAISVEEAAIKIKQIFQNSILVAHNARFDYGCLVEFFKELELYELEQPVIDTLEVSRFLAPTQKRHNLKELAKNASIHYDETESHRGGYDAEVLAKVWDQFLIKLIEKNIKDLNSLNQVGSNILDFKRRGLFSKEIRVIVKNQQGLKELFKLVSLSNTDNFLSKPLLFYDKILPSNNLLWGTSGLDSQLMEILFYNHHNDLETFIKKFDFIEIPTPSSFIHLIKRNKIKKEDIIKGLKLVIELARKHKKLIVASSEPRYINKEDKIFHLVYIYAKGVGGKPHNLFGGDTDKKEDHVFPTKYFMTTQELKAEFAFLEDQDLIDEIVVRNPNKIADLVEQVQVIKDKLYPPKFDDSASKIKHLVYQKAHEKYGENLPDQIALRIEKELNPIIDNGYDVVYWISKELVDKAKSEGQKVGSRGSVGSSVVAYLIGITEVNPLEPHYVCNQCKNVKFSTDSNVLSGFDLKDKKCKTCNILYDKDGQNIPFETFLGFKADKVPDIDLNFAGDFQVQTHNYIRELFGEKFTFRAGTILGYAEKSAFSLAKKLNEIQTRLYLNEHPNEYEFSMYSNTFLDFLATKTSGVKKTTGQHPGGIIVIPNDLEIEEFTPINFPANDDNSDWKTTHFDFENIHDNVLKFDLLGHDDPIMVRELEKLTNTKVENIPKSDPKIIKLFSSLEPLNIDSKDLPGEQNGARGLPEFGTSFVRRMLNTARVESFSDLIKVSGLSHGTNVWQDNAEALISQHNLTLRDVISCRDDIMLYLINKGVDSLVSFNIMESVRKGKSITVEQQQILENHNVPIWYIESLKKIKYMFPKAHAAAYVLMAWRITYYKLYYPLAFYSVYFSIRIDFKNIDALLLPKQQLSSQIMALKQRENSKKEDKLSEKEKKLIPILEVAEELKARGFEIEKINLNLSQATQWVINEENNSLIPPFSSLDGIGEANAAKIIAARTEKSFSSIEDFEKRAGVNSTVIKKLKDMGVFKDLSETHQITLFDY